MGWEQRGNREYYYHKERVSGRVVSQYIGAGEDAILIARLDCLKREKRDYEQWQQREYRKEQAAIDATIAELQAAISTVMRAVLVSEGYHTHKRQWRRTRDPRQEHRGSPTRP